MTEKTMKSRAQMLREGGVSGSAPPHGWNAPGSTNAIASTQLKRGEAVRILNDHAVPVTLLDALENALEKIASTYCPYENWDSKLHRKTAHEARELIRAYREETSNDRSLE
jgi:hypothetical protein